MIFEASQSDSHLKAMTFSAQHIKTARLHLRKSDPTLAAIIKQVGPFTAKARRDRLASLVRAIISQQISTKAAATIFERFKTAVKENRLTPPKRGAAFCATTILSFSDEALKDLGISPQKASYLRSLCQHLDDGEVDLGSLNKRDDEGVIECLTKVKGIGRWTAEMFLIFSLARLDVLPVDDLGIKKAAKNLYDLAELPDAKQLNQIAEPWRPYASIASWYLWRSLELEQ